MKKSLFSTLLIGIIVMTYFRKICHNIVFENKNAQIFALSHRNGAVDGWVYAYIFKNAIFTLAQQLHNSFFLRILFPGITLIRKKDISKTEQQKNIKSFKQCLQVLNQHKQPLCIFPEGTSDLGMKHLPFENGLSKIAVSAFKKNKNHISITPFAIFYDDPTHMGGSVFVQQGKSFNVNTEDSHAIHQQMTEYLEEILLEYNSVDEMNYAHKTAVLNSVFNAKRNYVATLYQLKRQPETLQKISQQIELFEKNTIKGKTVNYKKTTVYPINVLLSLWTFLITVIIVFPTILINAIPLFCGLIAGKKSKDENTVSLFKIIMGYWVGLFYYLILMILFAIFYGVVGILIVLCLFLFSLWGLKLYGAFKKHFYALLNLFIFRSGRKEFLRIYNEINTTLS